MSGPRILISAVIFIFARISTGSWVGIRCSGGCGCLFIKFLSCISSAALISLVSLTLCATSPVSIFVACLPLAFDTCPVHFEHQR
jgi:hypothetical protein